MIGILYLFFATISCVLAVFSWTIRNINNKISRCIVINGLLLEIIFYFILKELKKSRKTGKFNQSELNPH